MNVLVIDNNLDRDCWGASNLVRECVSTGTNVLARVRRGPQEDLPADLSRFDRIVISGSRESCVKMDPWVAKLDELIRRAIDHGKPVLGVCYGHQALVRAVGGVSHLRTSPMPEFGWTEIQIIQKSPLFQNLSDRFYSYSWHREEAQSAPKEMRILACSDHCAIQAVELIGRPAFGIQFHPEKGLADAERSLMKCRQQKIGPLLRPNEGKRLFDPEVGEKIFRNFLTAN